MYTHDKYIVEEEVTKKQNEKKENGNKKITFKPN